MEVSTIGLDLAKNVFRRTERRRLERLPSERLRRDRRSRSLRISPDALSLWRPARVRIIGAARSAKLGHEVRLIPPAYVKPFVKRQKNDMADAEAICEAAQRPTMRFVAVKSEAKQRPL